MRGYYVSAIEQIRAIIREKGRDIMQSDIEDIEALVVDIPIDDLPVVYPWIWESIALIVNDCLYEGDIEPID